MPSLLPSALALAAVAAAALLLARSRPSPQPRVVQRRKAARALAVALLVHTVHFLEEASSGFHVQFPATFGLPEMPFAIFTVFNLALIVVWIASIPGVRAGRQGALFAAWFLAIAGMLNGIAHPLLALASDDYFPGLVSSLLLAAAGFWLWQRLRRATRPLRNPPAPPPQGSA